MTRETYNFVMDVKFGTPKAILVTDGVEDYWLPRSQVFSPDMETDNIEAGDRITIFIEEWLAREKGLI